MNSNTNIKRASDLKEEGNLLFKSSKFAHAEEIYSDGLSKLQLQEKVKGQCHSHSESNHDESTNKCNRNDIRLRVVLHSNRGNCRFERGDYKGAVQDSKAALRLLVEEELQVSDCVGVNALRRKNQWRLARSLFYGKDYEALKKLSANINASANDVSFQKKIEVFVKSMEFYFKNSFVASSRNQDKEDEQSPKKPHFSPQIVRSHFSSPYCEYYPFGHDNAKSALDDFDFNVGIDRSQSNSQTPFNINILYGGIGDGRHMLATIIDADYTDNNLNLDFNLHITMNDINAQVLVKDILVLILSKRIGTMTINCLKSIRDIHKNKEVFLLISVLYYTTLGYAMPSFIYAKLQLLLQEIFLDVSFKSFCKSYPWIIIDEDHWSIFQRIVSYWVNISKYKPPLWSVEKMLKFHCPKDPFTNGLNNLVNVDKMGMNASQMAEMKRKQEEMKENQRKKYEISKRESMDHFKNISSWSPDFLEQMREDNGNNADETDDQLVDCAMRYIDKLFEDGDDGEPPLIDNSPMRKTALVLDKTFLKATHALIFPSTSIHAPEMKQDIELTSKVSRKLKQKGAIGGPSNSTYNIELEEALQESIDYIYSNWKVNPVKIDPDWQFYTNNELDRGDQTCTVTDFPSMYFHKDITKKFVIGPENYFGVFQNYSLFDVFAMFYINVGHAIIDLVNNEKLVIEVSYGSILDFGANVQMYSTQRLKMNLPTTFSCMFLSNIPDYVGMLSIFTQLSPLMAKRSNSISNIATPVIISTLQSNVLLNTGIFKSYDQYINGTLAMTVEQTARLLKLKVLDEKPDVWNEFNSWGYDCESIKKHPVSFVEFRTWMHRLFMRCALPPPRDSQSMVVEQQPNTVGLFLLTCTHCLRELNYPVHWVTSILDQLLVAKASRPLMTNAVIVNQSLSLLPFEQSYNKYDLSAFCLELENQIRLFILNGLLPDSILNTARLPVGKSRHYHLKIDGMNHLTSGDQERTPCLGFLLEKEINSDYRCNFMNSFLAMYGGFGSNPELYSLRNDLIEKGDDVGHLFSCAQYNAKTELISFYMCEDIFEKFKDYYFSIVRTDKWTCLEQKDHRLAEAFNVN